jgi:hypothetical protein
MDRVRRRLADPPMGRSAVVTQRCPVTACEHRRHPSAFLGELFAAHRVDAAVDPVQPAALDAVLDRLRAVSERSQLRMRDDVALACRDLPSGSLGT